MIHLSCRLDERAVVADAKIPAKPTLLAFLAERAAWAYGLDADMVRDALEDREKLGSTGFGGGIAIPHARIPGLDAPSGLVVRLESPLAFDAIDDVPVDLVFCLLSPKSEGSEHLRALAQVSRMLREERSVAKLRGAADNDAMFALLDGADARNAA